MDILPLPGVLKYILRLLYVYPLDLTGCPLPIRSTRQAAYLGIRPHLIRSFLILLIVASGKAPVHADVLDVEALAPLSIEELMTMEVTSPSRKSEKLADVASALFVLREEDIRRSGATTLPELLRLVPGLNVGRINSSEWAISARGFNAVFGDKLLVLIDGRSVYTPLFGGVFWNEHDIPLYDIDRIEVIRGPGATVWGVNATNGVINVVTKEAHKTKGELASVTVGTTDRVITDLRHGGELGEWSYRVYGRFAERDESNILSSAKPFTTSQANDDWRHSRIGFRADRALSQQDQLTVQGASYYGESGWDLIEPNPQIGQVERNVTRYQNGAHALARWTHRRDNGEEIGVQFYLDRNERNDVILQQLRYTADLELQHRFAPMQSHDVVWGAGVRMHEDEMSGTFTASVTPSSRDIHLYTGFVQDEITVVPELFRLVVGTKIEHSELSRTAFQPNLRAILTPTDHHSLWGSVSRALRSPARFNHDGRLATNLVGQDEQGLPIIHTVNGSRGFDPEELIAYELGYRGVLSPTLSVDVALFYNVYDDLESAEERAPLVNTRYGAPFVEAPSYISNGLNGISKGGEFSVDYRATPDWRLVAGYSYLDLQLNRDEGSNDIIFSRGQYQSPRHTGFLRSLLSLPSDTELDCTLRYVDEVIAFNVIDYWELDVRLGWKPTKNLELSLVGQNLLHDDHFEFASTLVTTVPTEVERAVLAKAVIKF